MKNNAVHCTNKYKHVTLLHAAATMLAVWSAGISFDITWGKCRLVNFFAGPCKKLVLRPNFVRMRWTQLFFQWFWIWLYGSVFHFADPHFMEIRIRISWKYGSVFPESFWVGRLRASKLEAERKANRTKAAAAAAAEELQADQRKYILVASPHISYTHGPSSPWPATP